MNFSKKEVFFFRSFPRTAVLFFGVLGCDKYEALMFLFGLTLGPCSAVITDVIYPVRGQATTGRFHNQVKHPMAERQRSISTCGRRMVLTPRCHGLIGALPEMKMEDTRNRRREMEDSKFFFAKLLRAEFVSSCNFLEHPVTSSLVKSSSYTRM